ncbi:MAG: hypothetical protein IJS88_04350 [Alphaproteobacteria bacterium]|nr:hypothetical protein [Alphaproteobacteria bacterium]
MRYITGEKLNGDMHEYRRFKNKKFSQSKYYKSEEVVERAEALLKGYETGALDVRAKDQKIMAQYIDTFAYEKREILLGKLQKNATFDVKEYLKDSKRTYWQKLFNIDPDKPIELSGKAMENRVKQYNMVCQQLSHGWFHKEKVYKKQYLLEHEADSYANAFIANRVNVACDDVPALRKYFMTFINQVNQNNISKAISKLDNSPIDTFAEKRTSRWHKIWTAVKSKWNGMKKNAREQAPRAKIVMMENKKYIKTAAFTGLLTLAGIGFLKSDTMAKTPNMSKIKSNTEIKANKNFVFNKSESKINTDAFAVKTPELTHEQKIWKNFYDTKNEIHGAALNIDVDGLYKQIESQKKAGVFTVSENISNERIAYTHLMYMQYGLQSPIEVALNSKQKISESQQKAIEEAINIAGEDGVGIRKLSVTITKRMGRKISKNSAFDRASNDLQQKFIASRNAVNNLR